MPELITQEFDIGAVEHAWTANEYEQYPRGKWWYVIMIPVGAFMVLYGIVTGNFLFSLLIILFAIVLFVQAYQKPPVVEFKITDTGIVIGTRFYAYAELDDFFIVYRPPEMQMLYIETNNTTRPLLRLPLDTYNPVSVRLSLRAYLPENLEKDAEPMSDRISRNWLLG